MKSSIIRELLKVTSKPGIISFGGGLPAGELFPILEIREAAERMILEKGRKAFQYGETEGVGELRSYLADYMKSHGIPATPEQILITSGSQQGLDLCGRVFLNEGDTVITSNPTYLGAIQAFNAYHPKYVTCNSDDDGMMLDNLEAFIKKEKPKFIYQVPTFQNPDGRTLPKDRRAVLLDIAGKYSIPIIEDDPYSALVYEGTTPQPLKAMSPEQVVFLSTFSKTVCPGFRVAWILAPEKIIDKFVKMKQGCDLHTSTMAQYLLLEYIKIGSMDKHIEKIKEVYGKRMQAMLKAIEEHFPKGVRWTKPTGGMFLWVELPKEIDTEKLLYKAIDRNVAFVPGHAFYPDESNKNAMRLNFSYPSEEAINEGIMRLGNVIKEELLSCGCSID
jgi:DNA-binding transcriptional MocR family regulator